MSDPPPYLSSPNSIPTYTLEPQTDETRLDYRPAPPPPVGIYVRKNDNLTVVLHNLPGNADVPCYGRHTSIVGSLHFDNPINILKVSMKLTGKIKVYTSSHRYLDVETLNETHILYHDSDGASSACPNALPFTIPFPEEFDYGGEKQKLPPTYRVTLHGVEPGQYAECKYTLQILVMASRSLGFLGKTTNKSSIEIRYNPFSRPPLPILPNYSLLETIKTCPEEWKEYHLSIPPLREAEELSAQLYLPMIGIFTLTDTIPFHLHFTGSPSLLSTLATQSGGIQVSLFRRFRVIEWQYVLGFTIGETTTLRFLPSESDSLDWEGTLKVKEDSEIGVGSFAAGPIAVDDFVAVELRMQEREGGPKVVWLKEGVRIKLVSDTWSEAPGGQTAVRF